MPYQKPKTTIYRVFPAGAPAEATYWTGKNVALREARRLARLKGESVAVYACRVTNNLRRPDLLCAALNGDAAWCSSLALVEIVPPGKQHKDEQEG
jgi:hypothetical protein